MNKKVLGIDPGKSGFFVLLDENNNVIKYPMPLIGNEYDKQEMIEIINEADVVCMENPGIIAMVSKSSVASLYRAKGIIEGILAYSNKEHYLISPKEWQSKMWIGINKQYKKDKSIATVDTKATSLLAAQAIFPNEDFYITNKLGKSKNPNDNFVDALLIAAYCKRNLI